MTDKSADKPINWAQMIFLHFATRFSAFLFLVGITLFLVYVAASAYRLHARLISDIEGRLDYLAKEYQEKGITRLASLVGRQSHSEDGRFVLYSVDTVAIPSAEYRSKGTVPESSVAFFMERALQRDQREAFWVRARQLAPEVHVSVARYFSSELQERVENAMQVAVMLLCFWIGAVLTTGAATYRATERSRAVHAEIIRIIRGSTKERLSTDDPSMYVAQLIEAGNTILEHVESLVVGVRTVSDNIAHDLRTPLTRLRNKLSQLRQQVDSSHIQQIDQILSDCDDLLTSFNALLRISLLEVGSQLPADGQLVSLRKVLQDVVEMYEPVAHEAGVLLSFHSEYVDQMIGEPDLLGQMFANLIDNAIKYTPPGGRIVVRLERDSPKWLRVLVSDNGRGIPEEERANVFRRFYRGEPSRGESKGHGLGLSLVQAIVSYHRGSIVLSDNNPGLRVSVLLPVALESKSRVGAQGVR